MDWDWVIKGDHVYDTRRDRRSRLLRKRHMARVFRMLAAVTTVFCLVGVGTFAWIGVEQAGASRRAAQSAALADEGDRSAGKYARMVEKAHAYNRKLAAMARACPSAARARTASSPGIREWRTRPCSPGSPN